MAGDSFTSSATISFSKRNQLRGDNLEYYLYEIKLLVNIGKNNATFTNSCLNISSFHCSKITCYLRPLLNILLWIICFKDHWSDDSDFVVFYHVQNPVLKEVTEPTSCVFWTKEVTECTSCACWIKEVTECTSCACWIKEVTECTSCACWMKEVTERTSCVFWNFWLFPLTVKVMKCQRNYQSRSHRANHYKVKWIKMNTAIKSKNASKRYVNFSKVSLCDVIHILWKDGRFECVVFIV